VRVMCEVLEVSHSGYYAWLQRKKKPCKRKQDDERLAPLVKEAFDTGRKAYGSPRIYEELRANGTPVSRRRVRRLMKEQGLMARKKPLFVVTTNSEHNGPVADNILGREFSASGPGEKLAGDITYLPTNRGFIYLAVILDLYSRRVVGYAVGATLETSLALSALDMVLSTRTLKEGAIHHTDRGTQYASEEYVKRMGETTMVRSMSDVGDCWDNAPSESFFSSLKFEVGDLLNGGKTPQEVRCGVLDYIAFYNLERRHSSIGYVSPAEFERSAHRDGRAAA